MQVGAARRLADRVQIQPPQILLEIVDSPEVCRAVAQPCRQTRRGFYMIRRGAINLDEQVQSGYFPHVRILKSRGLHAHAHLRQFGRVLQRSYQDTKQRWIRAWSYGGAETFFGKCLGN